MGEHFPSLLPGRQIPQPRVRRRGTGTFSGVGDRRSPRRLRLGGGKLGQGHDHRGGVAGRGGKDGAGDGKPLLLPAGQGGRVRIPVLVKAKFFEQMYCTVFAFFRQFGIQQQFLRHTRRKKTALMCHCRSNRYSCAGLPLLLFSIFEQCDGANFPSKMAFVNPFSHPLGSKIGRNPW